MLKQSLLFLLLATFAANATAQNTKPTPSDALNAYFKPMKWRNIGPFRGGRSGAVTGVPGDISTYFMGVTGGGVWKTDDLGLTWRNVSDGYFTTGSVGAITVAESDPNVIYVGMGEHAVRGVMTHHGDGMYKSTDGGKTWKKTGLAGAQHIARIVVHPANPDVVLVAVQGALYGPSAERGIFMSTDGGAGWKKVLYVDEKTGCAELSMDHNNPRILYAAMWEHGRRPWQVISGGPGSGLYKSTDSGETWSRLEDGLPREMGKMSIAVCRSNPDKVYALIESDSEKEAGGLFVSNNAGRKWSRVTNDHRLVQRAWYYIELFTDPLDDQTIYVLSAPALRSTDGGNTWEELSGTHGDYHDLWINPSNPKNMIIGNDGGAAVTVNGGATWSPQNNIPTAQMYRINADNQFPYRIYGGQQDYGSISIPHRELGSRSISPSNWGYAAGGESAFLAFDPDNPRYVLGGSYQGTIEVLDTKADAGTNIMAAPMQYLGLAAKDLKYRFNWNAPIIWSKHEPNAYYHAAHVLLKTTDMGKTWKEVSPDLTRNEKEKQGRPGVPYTNEAVGAENYGTISYVIESPHEKGVFWVGSDDGLVHLTTDGGANWRNVTPKGLEECLINAIEVSPHDKGAAYIATTRYKFNDHRPGLYKTTDYGKTWTNINAGIPDTCLTRVVREDQVRKDLLFAGTETGLFISRDGGKNWSAFQLNLPVTPITDLKIHQGDLIAATSGRSFWILDDLGLLRQFDQQPSSLQLFQPENAVIANGGSELNRSDESFSGMGSRAGVNPANGIVLYYHLPEVKEDETLTLQILDAAGNPVRSFSSKKDDEEQIWDGGPPSIPVLSAKKGLNRFVWDMRYPIIPGIPGTYFENSFSGHKASPGTYSFQLSYGKEHSTTTAEILPNPLYPTTTAEYGAYHQLMSDMEAKVAQMHRIVNNLHAKRIQLDELLGKLPADAQYDRIRRDGRALSDKIKAWDEAMVQRKSKAYDDVENFPNKFSANYMFLLNQTESDLPRVNQPNLDLKTLYDMEWTALKARADVLLEKEIPAFNRLLWEAGVGGIWMGG
jgi:photosystem II stability/assembly factor-like uncharacterized protein